MAAILTVFSAARPASSLTMPIRMPFILAIISGDIVFLLTTMGLETTSGEIHK